MSRKQSAILIGVVVFALFPALALAADSTVGNAVITSAQTPFGKFGEGWSPTLQALAGALFIAARILSIIMIAAGGVMVAFGVESGNRVLWNAMLGIGLAINFGAVVLGLWGDGGGLFSVGDDVQKPDPFKIAIAGDKAGGKESSNFNILGDFMKYYVESVIKPGAQNLVPIASNLLLIFVCIDGSVKLALDLISGDKIKYLVQTALKTGFMLFLIHNWFGGTGMNLMGSLGTAFQQLGFAAAGVNNGELNPNDIINNGMAMFTSIYGTASQSFSIMSPLNGLCQIVILIAAVILIFLTGLEMFMTRVEFYTMALITIPLIPFGVISQLKFLWEKALGAMFNLSVKLFVICFIQSVCMNLLHDYAKGLADHVKEGHVELTMMVQLLLIVLMLYFLVKKIPAMVQGLLSGSPSLSGGEMKQMMGQAAQSMKSAGQAAANVAVPGAGIAAGAAMNVAGSAAGGFAAGAEKGGQMGMSFAGSMGASLPLARAMGGIGAGIGGVLGGAGSGGLAGFKSIKGAATHGLATAARKMKGGQEGQRRGALGTLKTSAEGFSMVRAANKEKLFGGGKKDSESAKQNEQGANTKNEPAVANNGALAFAGAGNALTNPPAQASTNDKEAKKGDDGKRGEKGDRGNQGDRGKSAEENKSLAGNNSASNHQPLNLSRQK